ncbi:MAG: hypothetical protein KA185_07515 [Vitreoscilla sp.]|nr:hypothetical protein [Vitreoscilla sp.]
MGDGPPQTMLGRFQRSQAWQAVQTEDDLAQIAARQGLGSIRPQQPGDAVAWYPLPTVQGQKREQLKASLAAHGNGAALSQQVGRAKQLHKRLTGTAKALNFWQPQRRHANAPWD